MTLNSCIEKCFYYKFPDKQPDKTNKLLELLEKCGDENYIHRYPYSVLWKVTTACNLRCKHCLYYSNPGLFNTDNNFSTDEILKLARYLIEELNVISFSISGGEPFMFEGIFQLLAYLRSKNVFIDIKTNATLISEAIKHKLREILNPAQTTIQVSLESAIKAVNDKIRGKGSFEKTTEGIKRLTSSGFHVRLSCTVTSENIKDICLLYDLCKETGVQELLLGKFKVCSKEQAYLQPDLGEVFLNTAKLVEAARNDNTIKVSLGTLTVCDFLNYDTGIQLMDKYIANKPAPGIVNLSCHKHNRFVLNADGKVYLCTDTETDKFCLGDLKQNSFEEIWDKRFENIFFRPRNKCICTRCKYVPVCHGGCPARALKSYGDINAPDGSCSYARKMNYI